MFYLSNMEPYVYFVSYINEFVLFHYLTWLYKHECIEIVYETKATA